MRHAPALDGLRALAVTIVIASHAGLGKIVPGGFGVTIFFFLSGYLITSLLRAEAEKDGTISLRRFYARRVLRIFPPLYLTTAVVMGLIATGSIPMAIGPNAVTADVLFLTNYAYLWTTERGLPMPLWSLDVEEHFYLVFPLLFIGLNRTFRAPSMLASVIAGICVFVLAVRIANVAMLPDFSLNYYWSHTRIDSILFGACLAVWNNPVLDAKAWRPNYRHVALATVLMLATFLIRDEAFRESIRYSIQGASLFVLFSFVLHDRGVITRALSSWPLRWVGLFSYTLYLAHMPAFLLVEHYAPSLGAVGLGVSGTLLALAYSAVMYWAVEKPVAQWRRSLRRKGSSVVAATT